MFAFLLGLTSCAAPAGSLSVAPAPRTIEFEGERFRRMGNAELMNVVRGHQLLPVIQSSPHTTVRIYGKDGRYEAYHGADIVDQAPYAISQEKVVVESRKEPRDRYFYRSPSGHVLMVVRDVDGKLRMSRQTIQEIE